LSSPPTGVVTAPIPTPVIPLDEPLAFTLATTVLGLAAFFAVLRAALLRSVPERVLEHARTERQRERLRPLLERVEALVTSASTFELACQMMFALLAYGLLAEPGLGWSSLGLTLAISIPLLLVASEVLPGVLSSDMGDALLVRVLPAFHVLQLPLAALVVALEALRRGMQRLFRIPDPPRSTRRMVEALRDVIEEAELGEDLQPSERDIIENVVEFHDVDVAEIMTPRTEICAVERREGIHGVVREIAEHGHHRIPIFDGSLDSVAGMVHAQDVIELLDKGELEGASIDQVLRPLGFIPETKLVSELLEEFRRDQMKVAVVLDEYGGTAGLVTKGDVLAEIVGDMREEIGAEQPDAFRQRPDGTVEVLASTRLSDVNEELGLELPEEADYETLAGHVLAEIGHLPKAGESFVRDDVEFRVLEANDRRILKVGVRQPQKQG
jgi:putative hemolysin